MTLPWVDIAFSYQTPIGYRTRWEKWHARRNRWGPTTGKHLNWIDASPEEREEDGVFLVGLHKALGLKIMANGEQTWPV